MSHHQQLDADLIARDMKAKIEAQDAEIERLRDALKTIAIKAGGFEGHGNYMAYVILASEIEFMADSAATGGEA